MVARERVVVGGLNPDVVGLIRLERLGATSLKAEQALFERAEGRTKADPTMIGPVENRAGIWCSETFNELSSGVPAIVGNGFNAVAGHVEVKATLFVGEAHSGDAVAITRQPRLGIVGPVLHRLHNRAEKAANLREARQGM